MVSLRRGLFWIAGTMLPYLLRTVHTGVRRLASRHKFPELCKCHTFASAASSDTKRVSWEFPPAVCGHQNQSNDGSLESAARWSMVGYHIFSYLASHAVHRRDFGVTMQKSTFFFDHLVNDDDVQLRKMQNIQKAGIEGFRHSADIIRENGIKPEGKYKDAYELTVPVIDTDQALRRMTELIEAKGGKFIAREINQNLLDAEEQLRLEYNVDAIVNASGLGARVTAGDDTVYPLRGAVMRAINNDTTFHKVKGALAVSATNAVGLSQ